MFENTEQLYPYIILWFHVSGGNWPKIWYYFDMSAFLHELVHNSLTAFNINTLICCFWYLGFNISQTSSLHIICILDSKWFLFWMCIIFSELETLSVTVSLNKITHAFSLYLTSFYPMNLQVWYCDIFPEFLYIVVMLVHFFFIQKQSILGNYYVTKAAKLKTTKLPYFIWKRMCSCLYSYAHEIRQRNEVRKSRKKEAGFINGKTTESGEQCYREREWKARERKRRKRKQTYFQITEDPK